MVLSEWAWELSDLALVGLIANEIALAFAAVDTHENETDEASKLVFDWGFMHELAQLGYENKHLDTSKPLASNSLGLAKPAESGRSTVMGRQIEFDPSK